MKDRGLTELGRGSVWALASVAVALSCSILRTLVSVRFLHPAEIGLLGIGVLSLGFVEAVASTGIDTALTATRKDVERYIDPGFTIQVARGLAVFGFLWAAAPLIASLFGNDAAVAVVRSVAAVALLRGVSNPAVALAVRRLDFRRVFWWSLPEVLSSLFLTVVLLVWRGDVWALVIAVVAGQAVGTLASYGLVPRLPRLVVDRRIPELLRFSRFVSGSRALMYFSVNTDGAVVAIGMGSQALGLYQFAMRVAELPVTTFTRAVGQVALPSLSAAGTGAPALTSLWRTMLGWVIAVNLASAMLIVIFGDAAVEAVAGERWLPAVPVMKILAVAMLFRAVLVLTGQLLDAVGRPAETMRLNAVRLALLVLFLIPLTSLNGLQGAAEAVLAANTIAALYAARLSGRYTRIGTPGPPYGV